MGVSGLWPLLNAVKKCTTLSECTGKKLAIDLSAWILQCGKVKQSGSTKMEEEYLCFRGIFFKTQNLLSLGIIPIFVMDGPTPPALKKKTKCREIFYQKTLKYKELLLAMGTPVVESCGEAEKTCAELNRQHIVDGVLTDDGDVFVYGAQTIFKGASSYKKGEPTEKYVMSDITSELGLTQRDLVVFALLSKGDFCEGVQDVGEKKFMEMLKEFKQNLVEDALERLKSWKTNEDLMSLTELQTNWLELSKSKHCTYCSHEGTKQLHKSSGCIQCKTFRSCTQTPDSQEACDRCTCSYHAAESRIKPYRTELKIRQAALKSNPEFPEEEVIREFLEPAVLPPDLNTQLSAPNISKACDILHQNVKIAHCKTVEYLKNTFVNMNLYGVPTAYQIKPTSILKSQRHNFEQCYLTEWQIEGMDPSLGIDASCEVQVPADVFKSSYPDLVQQFTSRGNKRKADVNLAQPTITSFFKVAKTDRVSK
ncbi:uncharacterized protein LOC131948140 [Physella acuta]|uniref:uncharacterized protein LOC131948140 n=1 Tax=Physella acuta TaxID=109671 RepID=UPI0027DB65D9|nr:uncharacterized protein LOC131948140 [Physella acuta]